MKAIRQTLKYLFLIFLLLLMSGPVVTTILASIRTTGELLADPFGLPQNGIQWQNYSSILVSASFWRAFWNSLLITAAVATIVVVLSSMLAFIFSRVEFRGSLFLFNVLTLGLLFPLIVAILPVFIQVRQLGLINSLWGVILPMSAFGLAGSTVILRSFFRSVPFELEDAASVDGCSLFGFFRHILLPISRPSLMAVATLQIVASWNEYFLPLLVLNDSNKWPLPLGIMQFQGQFSTDWSRVMAYVTLLIIPALVFYIFTERYIVTGLTGGELKG